MNPNTMSGNTNRSPTEKEDAPPSYSEATKNQPNPHVNYTAPIPSAPTLESTANTNPYPTNIPAQFIQADTSHSLAQNYPDADKWDNRATRLLIMNRLQMQQQFDNAETEMESEALWKTLLNQLLGYGYNFSVIDLMNYWKFQFNIYQDIVKNLQSGVSSGTYWEFFEPMNRVFGHYDVTGNLAETVPSSTTSSILPDIPIPVMLPIPVPPLSTVSNYPSTTLSNSESTALNVASDVHATSASSPSTNELLLNKSLNEQTPLLSSASAVTGPSYSTDSVNIGNASNKDQEPITAQPEGLSSLKLNNDNAAETVVTRQPTHTETTQQERTQTANNQRYADDCCGSSGGCYPIFCIDCSSEHHYYHTHEESHSCCCTDGDGGGCCDGDGGGCCGGDGGGCCDGDGGGCCGGDGGGCCDGTDDVDCCDDCAGCADLGGCDGC